MIPFRLATLLRVASLWAWLVFAGAATVAWAGECPTLPGASAELGQRDAAARIAFLRQAMRPARPRAQRWFWGWTAGFSALTVGQLGVVLAETSPPPRRTLFVNAASTALGAGLLAVSPPRVIGDPRRLDAFLAGAGEDRCAELAFAEQLLVRQANTERFGRSWFMHGGNVLINVGAGLILGLGWQQWESAGLTMAAGLVVGELLIWTQPMDGTRALARYRSGAWAPTIARRPILMVHPTYTIAGPGVGITASLQL